MPSAESIALSVWSSLMSFCSAKFATKTARVKAGVQPSSAPINASRAAFSPFCGKRSGRKGELEALSPANARKIAPHIAPLGRKDVERRVVQTLQFQDRSEQEWSPAQSNLGIGAELFDAHGSRIGIGAAELIPELDFCHCRPYRRGAGVTRPSGSAASMTSRRQN